MPDIRKHYREVKRVLRTRDLIDAYFVGKFAFSPYHACAHGCLYCDGRAEKYFVEGEFDRDIVVRTNAAPLLAAELKKQRERGIVFIGSGVSDAYQPPEGEEGLMRACAQVLADRSMPATLLTKSAMVERDLDLWEEVHRRSGFLLMMSIMTLDEKLRRIFEPGASPIDERLQTLSRFRERGIPIGAAVMPFLPGLSDSEEQLRALAARLVEVGAHFALFGGLTLRPGRQKSVFFGALSESFPDLLPYYDRLYAENRPSGSPIASYSRTSHARALAIFREAGLPTMIPHRLYRDRIPRYDEVDVLLQQMLLLYADHPAAADRLRPAANRYRAWLQERKKIFNRRRKQTQGGLEAELLYLATGDGLKRILENDKLSAFVREVVEQRREFDPLSRELV